MLRRPEPADCDSYYFTYIDQVHQGDVLELLATEGTRTRELLATVPQERERYRYAPGKWSLREVIGHVLDAERVFGFRALSFARRAPGELPSMEQDEWVPASRAHQRPLTELADELAALRRSHLAMFRGFDGDDWEQRGVASGFGFTVVAIPYILLGHELHHRRVLAERYLGGQPG